MGQTVLRDVIGWQDSVVWGDATGIQAQSPSLTVTISSPGRPGLTPTAPTLPLSTSSTPRLSPRDS